MLLVKKCLINSCTRTITSSAGKQKLRALMYMPGDDMRKISKGSALDLDVSVMDCEDAVADNRKEVARSVICDALNTLDFGRTVRGVRTNSVSSGLIEDDLGAILSNKTLPDVLMVPKVDNVEEVDHLNALISPLTPSPLPIIFQTESAIGLINLHDVIRSLLASSHLQPIACVFGADDYASDIRSSRDISALTYARQRIVTYARAYNLHPIDRVHIEYKDLEGLRREAEQGFGYGFSGKQCIHPTQIPVVQAAFSCSPAQLEYAKELIRCWDENQRLGKGAFSFRGKMIDRPTLLQAKNVVEMYEVV